MSHETMRDPVVEPGLLPSARGRQTWREIRALLLPRWPTAAAALIVMTLSVVAAVAVPRVIGMVVDHVLEHGETAALYGYGALLLAIALVNGIATGAAGLLVARFGEPAVAELRERVLTHALGLPVGRVEGSGTGDVVARVSRDVQSLSDVVRSVLVTFGSAALTLVVTLGGLALIDWRFAVAALCAVPVQAFAARRYVREAVPMYASEATARGAQTQQLVDTLSAVETVRALGLRERHLEAVQARAARTRELELRTARLRTRFFQNLNAAEFIGTAAVLVVGFLTVRSGTVTAGAATAAALMFIRLFGPINIVLALLDEVQSAAAGLARLVGVLHERAGDRGGREGGVPSPPQVSFERVAYHYPGAARAAVRGVTLDVPAGARVALVGSSGAGKTTVAALLTGLRHPTEGRVLIEGQDIAELSSRHLADMVKLITQEVHVFAGSLREDLTLARPNADERELSAALERVGASWVARLPAGLDTIVGAGGETLTPVQAQQLALARVELADPDVVVLDEATAEAGSLGARALEDAVEQVVAGRTALVIAHRLSQADRCDLVAVMENGRVVESGAPDRLRADPGSAYARLWASWSASGAAAHG